MRAAPLEEVLAASAAAAPPAEAASEGEGLEVEVPAWARPYARREARPRPPAPPAAAARAAAAAGGAEVLVAHEHAIRGIDLPHLDLVLVTMLPDSPESYMHMAGRTGRVGQAGRGVMTSLVGSGEEVLLLQGVVEGELSRKLLLASNCVEEVESERRLQLEMQRREEERGQATDAGVLSSAMQTFEVDSGSGRGEEERDVSGLEATLEADVELSDAEQQAIDDLRRRLEDGFKNLDGEEGEEGAP